MDMSPSIIYSLFPRVCHACLRCFETESRIAIAMNLFIVERVWYLACTGRIRID